VNCKFSAALYIRVSTEEQATEGQSVPAQIEMLTQYCKLYNIEIYDIYKDLGISGKETKNRPELIRMLKDARKGSFNLVLVWKISRLSRSLKDLLLILDEFEKSGIVFNSYSEKFDTSTPVGKMTLQLLGSIAEFERNTIIDNVNLGLNEFARKGGKTGTVLGYDNCNKQLIINTDEAELVKMIYNLYTSKQMSMYQIAAYLNSMGFKTKRGNDFSKGSIAVILSNPVYISINRHKIGRAEEYKTEGSHIAIIETATWNTAQSLREIYKKKRPVKNKQLNFLLSGKIICPNCNCFMYSFTSTTTSKTYRYYRCKGCKCICNADMIESAVIRELIRLLKDENIGSKLITHLSLLDSVKEDNNHNTILKKESEKVQKLMDKYVLLLDINAFDNNEVIISKLKELEIRLKELQLANETLKKDNINNDPTKYISENYVNNLRQVLVSDDKIGIKTIMDSCIKHITLSSNKTFNELIFKFDQL
jgi:site-specific DNA recombinase